MACSHLSEDSRKVSFDGLTCSSFMFSDRYLEFLILLEESATLSDFHLVDSLVCSFFRDSVPYIELVRFPSEHAILMTSKTKKPDFDPDGSRQGLSEGVRKGFKPKGVWLKPPFKPPFNPPPSSFKPNPLGAPRGGGRGDQSEPEQVWFSSPPPLNQRMFGLNPPLNQRGFGLNPV